MGRMSISSPRLYIALEHVDIMYLAGRSKANAQAYRIKEDLNSSSPWVGRRLRKHGRQVACLDLKIIVISLELGVSRRRLSHYLEGQSSHSFFYRLKSRHIILIQ
ncbi:hypothetical protein H2248_004994 [Termitomyces sp. 'cryptogamus']|nr:hypothetical protein H2248_004994 [Termitomyces sp. 'cryptogamus']